jgi:valine--pyruvate aminotransferase
MSLSKLGLPGVRTGIIIANETIISTITGMNAVLSLAPGNIGAMLTLELVKSGKIMSLSKEVIKPYYRRKADLAVTWLREALAGVNFHIHKPEGAIFLWLWFEDLPITCQELYERLKQHGVLVVPGHHFFPGLQEPWQHQHECIRMTYSQEEDMVKEAIEIIGREVKQAYQA